MLPYTTPLSRASSSVRNSFTLAGTPALRTAKKKSNSTRLRLARRLEEGLEAREGLGPIRLLALHRRGARELRVADLHAALPLARREEADVDARVVGRPGDAHRLAVARAAHFDRRFGQPLGALPRLVPRGVEPVQVGGDGARCVRREAVGLLVHRAQPPRLLVAYRHHLAPPVGHAELAGEEERD